MKISQPQFRIYWFLRKKCSGTHFRHVTPWQHSILNVDGGSEPVATLCQELDGLGFDIQTYCIRGTTLTTSTWKWYGPLSCYGNDKLLSSSKYWKTASYM